MDVVLRLRLRLQYFDVSLSKDDVGDDTSVMTDAKVVIIRTGFSTHAM